MFTVLDTWPPEWHAPDLVVCNEMEIHRQKATTKFLAQHKWNEQLAEDVRVSWEVVKVAVKNTVVVGTATTLKERGLNLAVGHGAADTI